MVTKRNLALVSALTSTIVLVSTASQSASLDALLDPPHHAAERVEHYTVEYARFADDIVILIHPDPRNSWLLKAVDKRLREELAKLDVQINEEKSRTVDLARGESFGFLGLDFRRVRSLAGRWRPQYAPKLKKRTALLQTLREIFRRHRSQPVQWVVEHINPILRGWVNYFAIGYSSRSFQFVKRWVEVKVRRHLMRARKRRGLGWERWTTQWLHETLGLFNGYRLRRDLRKVVSLA
jgi:RNA-directed DNA polymerase